MYMYLKCGCGNQDNALGIESERIEYLKSSNGSKRETMRLRELTCISAGQLETTFPVVVVALNSSSVVPMATPLTSYTELTASCSAERDSSDSAEAGLWRRAKGKTRSLPATCGCCGVINAD